MSKTSRVVVALLALLCILLTGAVAYTKHTEVVSVRQANELAAAELAQRNADFAAGEVAASELSAALDAANDSIASLEAELVAANALSESRQRDIEILSAQIETTSVALVSANAELTAARDHIVSLSADLEIAKAHNAANASTAE